MLSRQTGKIIGQNVILSCEFCSTLAAPGIWPLQLVSVKLHFASLLVVCIVVTGIDPSYHDDTAVGYVSVTTSGVAGAQSDIPSNILCEDEANIGGNGASAMKLWGGFLCSLHAVQVTGTSV